MFAKLFSRITESSLMEEDIETRYVFVMLLAIADPTGHVIGTDVAIARRINVPLSTFRTSRDKLMSPDIDSNSPEEEGRRILHSEGERGYKMVNYLKYRGIKDEEGRREYMRLFMKEKRSSSVTVSKPANNLAPVSNGKQKLAVLAHAEAEAEAEAEEKQKKSLPQAGGIEPKIQADHAKFIELWTTGYLKTFGTPYIFQAGKDGSAVKSLLQTAKVMSKNAGDLPDKLMQVAFKAWSRPTGFNCKSAASICGFNSKFNEIVQEIKFSNTNGHQTAAERKANSGTIPLSHAVPVFNPLEQP